MKTQKIETGTAKTEGLGAKHESLVHAVDAPKYCSEASAIAGRLSASMREAILDAPSTPLGNTWLTCAGSTKSALVARRLARGHGEWCTLTDLGKAVRTLLKDNQDG